MDWIQFYVLIATFFGMFLWVRAESRSDQRQMQHQIDANQMQTTQKIEAIKVETNALIEAIRQDIKDFHGRLCTIEERNRRDR